MTHLDLVWAKTTSIFPILNQTLNDSDHDPDDFKHIITELNRCEVAEAVYETVWIEIRSKLQQCTVPQFWKSFHDADQSETSLSNAHKDRYFYQFQVAVFELHKAFGRFQSIVKQLKMFKQSCRFQNEVNINRNENAEFGEILRASLLAQMPANFNVIVHAFYSKSFKVFVNRHLDNMLTESNARDEEGSDALPSICVGCDSSRATCSCQDLLNVFTKTNRSLAEMQLLDRLAGLTLTALIQEQITSYVHWKCRGVFDTSHLASLEHWLETIVLSWLTRIYDQSGERTDHLLAHFKVKLSSNLYEKYASTIIEQFFNIIIDYPDSQPIIDDLKTILDRVDCRGDLVKSVRLALQMRLLHPGVNTNDILTGYVAAIKTIRHLDSNGVLLETITEPVKQYMRCRADAVRCVVTALTEEGPADLAEELAKSEALAEAPSNRNEELINWESWQPDPVDVNTTKQVSGTRSADIISMVVDIYGSKEMFVGEYRNLLADRLLTQLDFNPEKEIRNLELLKLRFGDSVLHNCEVMLKDISDSKRIDAHIHSDAEYAAAEKPFEISSLILSNQFWPTFKNDTIELPAVLQAEFERYTKLYESYKGNRTLVWRPAIGRVNVEVQLANRTIDIAVSPSQAAIIYLFQDKGEWSLEDLCQTLKVPPTLLRKRITIWQSHGIIREPSTDFFVLVEDSNGVTGNDLMQTQSQECEEDETESAMASASDQREEELQVFWSYIVGMLTNLDSMPLERIHQMLKMFASHGPGVEFSQEELKNFLQRKVREHELIFAGGVYHLPK